jgi:hypothetical protein
MYKDNKNEKMKRKTSPKNSTKRGFPVIPQALNRHYRDLRRLNKHQIPPNKHQTKKTRQGKRCTRLFGKTERIYAACSETTCVYTRLSRKKARICFETRPGKGERLKTQTQSEQELSSNDTTRTTIETREI